MLMFEDSCAAGDPGGAGPLANPWPMIVPIVTPLASWISHTWLMRLSLATSEIATPV